MMCLMKILVEILFPFNAHYIDWAIENENANFQKRLNAL